MKFWLLELYFIFDVCHFDWFEIFSSIRLDSTRISKRNLSWAKLIKFCRFITCCVVLFKTVLIILFRKLLITNKQLWRYVFTFCVHSNLLFNRCLLALICQFWISKATLNHRGNFFIAIFNHDFDNPLNVFTYSKSTIKIPEKDKK